MKCLTVCEPWADAMVNGPKAIENRPKPTSFRGPLLIHAGLSKTWLHRFENDRPHLPASEQLPDMPKDFHWGHIIGMIHVTDCVTVEAVTAGLFGAPGPVPFAWGPWCWLHDMSKRLSFETPIPLRGQLGIFEVDECLVADQVRLAEVAAGWRPTDG